MNGYEIKITANMFIQAKNQDDCEKYVREAILDAGLFNVIVSVRETGNFSEYLENNKVHTYYDIEWKCKEQECDHCHCDECEREGKI